VYINKGSICPGIIFHGECVYRAGSQYQKGEWKLGEEMVRRLPWATEMVPCISSCYILFCIAIFCFLAF